MSENHTEFKLALAEWLKNHKKGEKWEPIGAGFNKKNQPVVLLITVDEEENMFSVQVNGNGKYFKSSIEAMNYFHKMLKK